MKTKNRKLHRIIGLLLCVVMLIGMMPIQTAVALAEPAAQADELVEYIKVTSYADLEDGQYVIVYKEPSTGTRYALSTEGPNYSAEITQEDSNMLMVDPDGSYVFTMTNNGGVYNFRATNEEKTYLKLNSGNVLFDTSAGGITLGNENGYWSLKNSRGLTFDEGSHAFGVTAQGADPIYADFELWTQVPSTTEYIKLGYLEQLADFDSTLDFVIAVETEDGLKAMGSVSNGSWLHDIYKTGKNDDGIDCITVFDREDVVFNVQKNDEENDEVTVEHTSGMYNKIKYWGFGEYGIRLKTSKYHYYPQYIDTHSSKAPLRSGDFDSKDNKINYTVRFEYGTGNTKGNYSDKIYIRGNGGSTYLGYTVVSDYTEDGDVTEKSVYTGSLPQDSEDRIPVQIYVAVPDDAVRVEFLKGDSDEAMITTYANPNGTLSLTDKVDDVEVGDYTYTFVGWTLTKPETSFLSIDDSANIFDYDNEAEKAHISEAFAKKYGVIGDCNPESSPEESEAYIDLNGANDTVYLYPIYAVRGHDTVVAALEADGTKIIGVSDWKADQGAATYYDNEEAEKWLGYIDVQMFKDGVEWVKPTRLYYRYHNDNTADLTIKFIWDDLVDEYGKLEKCGDLDPLYFFMSDHEGQLPGKDPYPKYDQSGHFVLDAVYALQGGSEDGLKYELNWMTDHGGQLDNVEGGSLVRLFVSTKYDVKYYLDNEEITTGTWGVSNFSDKIYTTPGTEDLFNEIASDAEYQVHFDNNDLIGLMDPEFTKDSDSTEGIIYSDKQATDEEGNLLYDNDGNPIYEVAFNPHEWFIAEDYATDENGELLYDKDGKPIVKRGEPDTYSYVMHEYEHSISFAKSPEELVPEGRTLISKNWSLKDKSMKFQSAHEWATAYPLKGTEHGTGNTAASYMEKVNLDAYAADAPYTFHLYAYTGIPGDLAVDKTVTGNEGETDRDFNFTVTIESSDAFDADDINGKFGDMEFTQGVAEITLKHGESLTAEGLPAGVTYTVTEAEANQDGYITTATDDTGTIEAYDTVEAKFVNDRDVEWPEEPEEPIEEPEEPAPEEPPTPDVPNTGDNNNLAMWVLLMMASLFGMAIVIYSSKKRAKGTK